MVALALECAVADARGNALRSSSLPKNDVFPESHGETNGRAWRRFQVMRTSQGLKTGFFGRIEDHFGRSVTRAGLSARESATSPQSDPRVGGKIDNPSSTSNSSSFVSDETVRRRFHLTLSNASDDFSDSDADALSVVTNGTVLTTFADCSAESKSNSSACYEAGATIDRAIFRFYFVWGPNETNKYAPDSTPVVSAVGGRAVPQVVRRQYDPKTSAGSIMVKYMCSAPSKSGDDANATSYVTLRIPLSSTTGVNLVWKKVCGSGVLEHVDFGYVDHDKNIVVFHGDGTHGENKDVGMEVSPHDLSTQLSLRLKPPMQALDFLPPYVISSAPDQAVVSVRGAREGGTLMLDSDIETEVSVMYECKASVSAQIYVSIGIPPWNNLTASWTKDCGGKMPKSLLIGTKVAPSYDVMQDGELEPSYNVTGLTAPWEARSKGIKILDSSSHSAMFYLTNIDDASEIQIQSVTVTLLPSDVMFPRLEDPGIPPLIGDGYIGRTGVTLKRRETKRLQIHFYCSKSGSVIVLVTLATLLFQNVEFGFLKDCVEGQVYHRSAITAGSLMTGILLAMVLSACMVVCYRARKNRQETAKAGSLANVGKPGGKYSLVDGEDGLD